MKIAKRFIGVLLLFVISLWGAFCYFGILVTKGFDKAIEYDQKHDMVLDKIFDTYLN